MTQQPMAYLDPQFLESEEGRPIRIISEYLDPLRRFKEQKIQDTVVFFGSARVDSRERAERALRTLRARGVQNADEHYETELQEIAQGTRVGALLRGRARAGAAAHGVERHAAVRASSLRRDVRRRPRHHGGRQSRRARGRRQDDRAQHPACRSSRAPIPTSPTACTSSSTTSSCASSGSRTWRRRWSCFRAASARCDELFEILTLAQTDKLSKKIDVILYGTRVLGRGAQFQADGRVGRDRREGSRAAPLRRLRRREAFEHLRATSDRESSRAADRTGSGSAGIAKTRGSPDSACRID